jgi:predicted kinase
MPEAPAAVEVSSDKSMKQLMGRALWKRDNVLARSKCGPKNTVKVKR